MEAGMDDRLSRKCAAEKINKVVEFKKWMSEVKRVDDALRADRKDFENIVRSAREAGRQANPLGEPSRRQNTAPSSGGVAGSPRAPRTTNDCPRMPRLTDAEHKLIFDNEGCLKCRRFFAGHRSSNCNNDFPDPATYRTLMQADVDAAKRRRSARSVATVNASASSESHPIPVAPVVSSSRYPLEYMMQGNSSVLEGGDDSDTESDKVCEHPTPICPPVSRVVVVLGGGESAKMNLEGRSAPIPHLFWQCATGGPTSDSFPISLRALLDNGSHMDLIDSEYAKELGLEQPALH
jgi:hypothetical protein